MKILITGATGLIGKELIKVLLKENHHINFLTTSKTKLKSIPNCHGYFWNPKEGIIDNNCIDGVDVIVHLAGANIANRWTKQYKQEIIDSRTATSALLYNVVKDNPNQVKQIISASGTAIYPDNYAKQYNEASKETNTSFLGNVVKKWEDSVDLFHELGYKVCKLRTGVVLSNIDGALPKMVKPIQLGLGANMGSGKQIQSWIHIQDLVNLYYFAIQNQWEGVFNAVTPHPVSNAELTKTIATVLKRPLFLPNIPKFVMKLILGEMCFLLFSSTNCSADKILQMGFQFQFPTIRQAIENLYA